MSKLSKSIVTLVGATLAVALVAVPVKAGTLAQDQAWVKAQAEAGMAKGQAHLADIAAQAQAGMASGQAYLNAASATMSKDKADLANKAANGLAKGQAYLDAATATMNKDQAALLAQQAAGMAKGQAHLDDISAQAKSGMVAGATEAVRVAKANLASIKELAKSNPAFAEKIPAAEAALAQAEAVLCSLQ